MTQLYTSFPISELKTILALNDVVFPKKQNPKTPDAKALIAHP